MGNCNRLPVDNPHGEWVEAAFFLPCRCPDWRSGFSALLYIVQRTDGSRGRKAGMYYGIVSDRGQNPGSGFLWNAFMLYLFPCAVISEEADIEKWGANDTVFIYGNFTHIADAVDKNRCAWRCAQK